MSESEQTPNTSGQRDPNAAGDDGAEKTPATESGPSTSDKAGGAKSARDGAGGAKSARDNAARDEADAESETDGGSGPTTDDHQPDAEEPGSEPSDQDATDEAFEAIVDGVEFDPVDGAAYAAVVEERDEYLAALQRLKAEFDNHRRRSSEQATTQREQAAASLVEKLLPVLDALDAADAHELEAVRPIRQQFLEALTTSGLSRLHPEGESFDPEQHEAVMHEAGDNDEPQVTEVLRTGYAWNGRVLRPAMVKVQG